MIPNEYLSDEQKAAIALLENGPRKGFRGPFIPMLRSPEFLTRAQHLGEYLRYDSIIPNAWREFAILIAARIWSQTYEWHAHAKIAAQAGVPQAWIDELETTGNVSNLSKEYQIIDDFCRQLHLQRCVSNHTFEQATDLLSDKGVVELCGICGYYAMLAMLLNVTQTSLPEGTQYAFQLPQI